MAIGKLFKGRQRERRASQDSKTQSDESGEAATPTVDKKEVDEDDDDEEDDEYTKAPWRALFAFSTRSHLPFLAAGFATAIIAGGVSPAQNWIIGELTNGFTRFQAGTLTPSQLMKRQTKYVLIQVGISGGSWLFHAMDMFFWMGFGELQAKSARDRLFHGLLQKEIEWYDKRKNGVGALLPRMQAQIRELQLATAQPMGALVSLTATAILSLIQALVRSYKLTLVTLSTVPLILFIMALLNRPVQRNLPQQQDKLTEAQKYSTNAFSVIETVKCYNGQEVEQEKYEKSISAARIFYAWVANANALQMALLAMLTVSMFVQGFYYGGILISKGELNSGDVVTTFFSAIGAFTSISAIMPQMLVFEKGRTAGSTLRTIMAQIEEKSDNNDESDGNLAPKECHGNIEVRNLTFAYPTRPDVLAVDDVSMSIPGGKMTFIIGRSGSGKSTISQLLMRFYTASQGEILVDNVPLDKIDTTWLRTNITLVEQTSLLFNDTVFRNIAFGRKDYDNVTREEVMGAVEFALLQLMINDMPDGLETNVGAKGGAMSGGQRQRMALARARLRDSPILFLDESTSALDHITRLLMMEAIRRWRKGKTTIMITHDISQIMADDYIYLLENGKMVQEGYRRQVEKIKDSPFQGFLSNDAKAMADVPEDEELGPPSPPFRSGHRRTPSEYSITTASTPEDEIDRQLALTERGPSKRTSYFPNVMNGSSPMIGMRAPGPGAAGSPFAKIVNSPAMDWTSMWPTAASKKETPEAETPNTGDSANKRMSTTNRWSMALGDLMNQTGKRAADTRRAVSVRRKPLQEDDDAIPLTGREASLAALEANQNEEEKPKGPALNTLKYIFKTLWPSLDVKAKVYLIVGFWGASVHAVVSPIFSFLVSKMINLYSKPGGDTNKSLLVYAMGILGLSIADAVHTWFYRFFHEYVSQLWVDHIRCVAYSRILDQPKEFFEKEENGISQMTSNLDRNAEEMRNLLGRFASLCYVAVVMVFVSIAWSISANWKMTMIAMAVVPYIWGVTKFYAGVSERWEGKSNDASDVAAGIMNETFTNIKTVRSLTLEPYFLKKYMEATKSSLSIGFQRAFYSSFFFGVSDSAGNFATAVIFYVGSLLVSKGANTADIIQVFTMLLFTITSASAILEWIPQIGASKDSAARLLRLATLPKDSHEHLGDTRIKNVGDIVFDDLRFCYPSRPDQTVLKNISLRLRPGTATAIVGGSGSGKSTIANLLLDLYSTNIMADHHLHKAGELTFGGRSIQNIHTPSLRALIVVVSQTPTLFADTVAENIAYGLPANHPCRANIELAARQAGIHDFIVSLPQGYETLIGDGGTGLSGGQSQRISIARAIVRKPSVLILDEATSALDVESANLIRDTLRALIREQENLTVIIITHHKDMMEIAERVVVLDQGVMAEEGTFEELMEKKGALANLLSGGEIDAMKAVEMQEGRKGKRKSRGGAAVPILKEVDWSRKKGGAGKSSGSNVKVKRTPSGGSGVEGLRGRSG